MTSYVARILYIIYFYSSFNATFDSTSPVSTLTPVLISVSNTGDYLLSTGVVTGKIVSLGDA